MPVDENDWAATARQLGDARDWDRLWRLAQTAPLPLAARVLTALGEQGWLPEDARDRDGCARLIELARRCRSPVSATARFAEMTVLADEFGGLTGFAVHPRSELLAAGNSSGTLRLWDLRSGAPIGDLDGYYYGLGLVFAQAGSTLVARVRGGMRLWDLPIGAESRSVEGIARPRPKPDPGTSVVEWPAAMAMTPEEVLVSANMQGQIQLTPVADRKPHTMVVRRWVVNQESGHPSIAVTPDGRLLATGTRRTSLVTGLISNSDYLQGWHHGKVRLWKLPSGEPVRTIRVSRKGVGSLLVTPDGGFLVGVGVNGRTRVWRLPSGERVASMRYRYAADGHTGVVMSPDGTLLAGIGASRRIEVRRLPSGELVSTADPGTNKRDAPLDSFAVSTDGGLLAGTHHEQDQIRLWHLPSGVSAGSLACGVPGPTYLGFSPMGALVAGFSATRNGIPSRLLLWRPEPALIGHTPVGDLAPTDIQRLRRRLDNGRPGDLAWLDLLDALVTWRTSGNA